MESNQFTRLHFTYEMRVTYEKPVTGCHFTIKALPQDTARQKILSVSHTFSPAAVPMHGQDGFFNRQLYGTVTVPHREFRYRLDGVAQTENAPYEMVDTPGQAMRYRHPFGLNRPGPGIRAYFAGMADALPQGGYDRAISLLHRLHHEFAYVTGITTPATGAEDAWRLGGGVCQDYVHVYLALCHLAGIPARYVAGLVRGDGQSHAWAEILHEGRWIGVDPANDCPVTAGYVRFGCGRDATGCQLNRATLLGGGAQTLHVTATVKEE